MLKLDLPNFYNLRDLIHEASGLYFDEKKLYFVEKRAARRVKEGNYSSFDAYYRALKFSKNSQELWNLIELLTTNETYFFRHIPQLESFVEEALPLVLDAKRRQRDYTLNIWSAASSSGEEIYTIAIMLRENISDFARWKIQLLGTDIDRKILKKAQIGIYDSRSVKDVPPALLGKYFTPLGDGTWQLGTAIMGMARFQQTNLVDRYEMRKHPNQDFIFCRNVLIYFDDTARKQVIASLYNALNKDGFIFLGHSESVGRLSAAFKLVKFKKSLSYQK